MGNNYQSSTQATNIVKENRTTRRMRSGRYVTLDVICVSCRVVLGWFYEYSFDPTQKEKEGKVVLEMSKLLAGDAKEEKVVDNARKFFLNSTGDLEVSIPEDPIKM